MNYLPLLAKSRLWEKYIIPLRIGIGSIYIAGELGIRSYSRTGTCFIPYYDAYRYRPRLMLPSATLTYASPYVFVRGEVGLLSGEEWGIRSFGPNNPSKILPAGGQIALYPAEWTALFECGSPVRRLRRRSASEAFDATCGR